MVSAVEALGALCLTGCLRMAQDAEEETDGPTGPRAVFPALLLGTSMLGWVAASRCRIYSQADTQASAAEWMPQQIRDLRLRQNGSRETKDEGPTEPWLRRNILSCAVKVFAARPA